MRTIKRGTTPSIEIDFKGSGVNVRDISSIALTISVGKDVTELMLKDFSRDFTSNILVYTFTQEQTLAFKECDVIKLQADVLVYNNRFRCFDELIKIEGTKKNEVMIPDA